MNKKIVIAVALMATVIFLVIKNHNENKKNQDIADTSVSVHNQASPEIAVSKIESSEPAIELKDISDINILEKRIDQLSVGDKQSKIAHALGETVWGRRLSRMLILSSLYNYSEEVAPILAKLQKAYKEDFLSHPSEVREIVHEGLNDLDPDGFPQERFALIGTMGGIPALMEESSSMALSELQSYIPKERLLPINATEEQKNIYFSSNDPHYLYPIWMYQLYLDGVKEKDLASKETREILALQKDHQVIEMINNMFKQKFPK